MPDGWTLEAGSPGGLQGLGLRLRVSVGALPGLKCERVWSAVVLPTVAAAFPYSKVVYICIYTCIYIYIYMYMYA